MSISFGVLYEKLNGRFEGGVKSNKNKLGNEKPSKIRLKRGRLKEINKNSFSVGEKRTSV